MCSPLGERPVNKNYVEYEGNMHEYLMLIFKFYSIVVKYLQQLLTTKYPCVFHMTMVTWWICGYIHAHATWWKPYKQKLCWIWGGYTVKCAVGFKLFLLLLNIINRCSPTHIHVFSMWHGRHGKFVVISTCIPLGESHVNQNCVEYYVDIL